MKTQPLNLSTKQVQHLFSIYGIYLSIFIVKRLIVFNFVAFFILKFLLNEENPSVLALTLTLMQIGQAALLSDSYAVTKAVPFHKLKIMNFVKALGLSASITILFFYGTLDSESSFMAFTSFSTDSLLLILSPFTLIIANFETGNKFVKARFKHSLVSLVIGISILFAVFLATSSIASLWQSTRILVVMTLTRFTILSHIENDKVTSFSQSSITNIKKMDQVVDYCFKHVDSYSNNRLPIFLVDKGKKKWEAEKSSNQEWDNLIKHQAETTKYPWEVLLHILQHKTFKKFNKPTSRHTLVLEDMVYLKSFSVLSYLLGSTPKAVLLVSSQQDVGKLFNHGLTVLLSFQAQLSGYGYLKNESSFPNSLFRKRRLRSAFRNFQEVMLVTDMLSILCSKIKLCSDSDSIEQLTHAYIPCLIFVITGLLKHLIPIKDSFFVATVVYNKMVLNLRRLVTIIPEKERKQFLCDYLFKENQQELTVMTALLKEELTI